MMKLTIALGLTVIAASAMSQTVVVNRMGGYAYNSPYNRLYNQRSQITFSGVVTGIQKVKPMANMDTGTTLLVKNDDGGGTAVVELGPSWFVDQQVTKIKAKSRVEVTGSKAMMDGRGVILAKLVKSGNSVLALRRPNGRPYWDIYEPVVARDLGPDPNVYEVTGTVNAFRMYGEPGYEYGRLELNTPGGAITIDMGPQWFIQPQGFVFTPGSTVMIGGNGTFRTDPYSNVIPAYYFRTGNNTYFLRNPINGMGVWQGWWPNN